MTVLMAFMALLALIGLMVLIVLINRYGSDSIVSNVGREVRTNLDFLLIGWVAGEEKEPE